MLNDIYQKSCQHGKSQLPNPYPAHKMIIREKTLKNIMLVKGWGTYTDVGKALGFTRQYISMIAGGIGVSTEFIIRLAMCTGNIEGNWYIHFEIAPRGFIDDNHPTWNMQKHDGNIPYERFSSSAEFRSQDYSVEKKQTCMT